MLNIISAVPAPMPKTNEQTWQRIRTRLRAELGDDIFTSWFQRLDLVRIVDGVAELSVPTRFLKSWLQGHYIDRIEAIFAEEHPTVRRVSITLREAGQRAAAPRTAAASEPQVSARVTPSAAMVYSLSSKSSASEIAYGCRVG